MMKTLNKNDLPLVAGGVPANPNACQGAILGSGGIGGALGTVIGGLAGAAVGALAGPGGAAAGAAYGAAIGAELGTVAGGAYAAQNNPACSPAPTPTPTPPPTPTPSPSPSGGGGAACVQVNSLLPCGTTAGAILAGAALQLAHETTLEASTGTVTYSKRKKANGFRILTANGASLVCSDTAPIPTTDGLVLAPNVSGKMVAVRRDDGSQITTGWELVASVDAVGEIDIQHISVNDQCFWAGEKSGAYILHHNKYVPTADGDGGDGD